MMSSRFRITWRRFCMACVVCGRTTSRSPIDCSAKSTQCYSPEGVAATKLPANSAPPRIGLVVADPAMPLSCRHRTLPYRTVWRISKNSSTLKTMGYRYLIRAGMAHAQFETIHPFQDGNGRVGRLLITLLLCKTGMLKEPLLYLSLYLKQHREEYYALLQQVRLTGDWEAWLTFFLEGVRVTAEGAVATASSAGRNVCVRPRYHRTG